MDWEPILEMQDEETGEILGYSHRINANGCLTIVKEAYRLPNGKTAHDWSVEICYFGPNGGTTALKECKTLTSAKRWAAINKEYAARYLAD